MSGEGSLFDVPPAAIGRFRVLHQVGAGTSGPVFRAAHPEGDAPLAIKLVTLAIPPERVAAVVADLEALVGAVSAIDGVCPLIDAGAHSGMPYLVTSFAPGDSLDVALKQFGPAALTDLVPRLRVLARALDEAAEARVLHGALHPRDVLVSDTTTMLTGLGVWPILARAGERLPIRRPYRAPELSDAAITAAGDRFSLAALAYEWTTGRRAPSAFVAGDMAPITGADRIALGRIFARALHADPDERYDSGEAFVADLEEVEVDEAALAAAEPPRAEPKGRKRAARGGSMAAGLPLETRPDAEPESPPPVEPDPLPLAATEPDPVPQPDELRVDRGDARVSPETSPVAAAPLRPAMADEFRSPSLLSGPLQPPATHTSGLRFAAGLLIGAMLGIGVGYGVWGRGSLPPSAVGDTTVTDEVAAPDTQRGGAAPADTPPAVPSTAADPPPGRAPAAETPAAPAPAPNAAPAAPPPALVATGNLLVRSTPAGAAVFVDDERRGVTPLTLQNVPLGTRRVRIQRDGFTSEDRQVNLTRSRPSRSVDVRLTRAAPSARPTPAAPAARTGSLLVESRPTGASVMLNGRPVGTTPMTIDDLAPGTYTVQLQLPTYRPSTTTVRVVAGERARAAASLVSVQEPE